MRAVFDSLFTFVTILNTLSLVYIDWRSVDCMNVFHNLLDLVIKYSINFSSPLITADEFRCPLFMLYILMVLLILMIFNWIFVHDCFLSIQFNTQIPNKLLDYKDHF